MIPLDGDGGGGLGPLPELRLVGCGSRNWDDVDLVAGRIRELSVRYRIAEVAHGAAPGADTIFADACRAAGVPPGDVHGFAADWTGVGLGAGKARNRAMLRWLTVSTSAARLGVVVFKDAFGMNPGLGGSEDMADIASREGVPVLVCSHDRPDRLLPYRQRLFS